MKKLSMKWSFLIFAAAAATLFTSCEDDTIGPGTLDPDVSFTTAPVDTAEEGTVVAFTITANPGDNSLNTIVITEDGTDVAIDRLEFEDGTNVRGSWGANPKSLDFDEFRDGITWTVYLTVHEEAAVTKFYNIRVTDSASGFDDLGFSITSGLPTGPSLIFSMDVPMTEVDPASLVSFTIETQTGDADLSSIGLTADGIEVDASRLAYRIDAMGSDINWTANPESLDVDGLRDGFIWRVFLRVHPEEGTTKQYQMTLSDANGLSDVYDFSVSTNSSLTLESIVSQQWWNFNGPNAGCIDLATGETWLQVDAESNRCDLIDLGTDTGGQAGNWLKGFKAENGAEVRFATPEFSPSSYSSIIDEFNANVVQGDAAAVMGAWYLARDADDNYYAFEFTEINETTNDSQDFYRIRILKEKI